MKIFKSLWIKAFLLYQKFQIVILGIFVFGIVEFMAYSDLIYVLLATPEFAPVIIIFLMGYGMYRFYRRRRGNKDRNRDEHEEKESAESGS